MRAITSFRVTVNFLKTGFYLTHPFIPNLKIYFLQSTGKPIQYTAWGWYTGRVRYSTLEVLAGCLQIVHVQGRRVPVELAATGILKLEPWTFEL